MPDVDLSSFENNENVTVEMCLDMMKMMKGMMESLVATVTALETNQRQLIQQLENAQEQVAYLTGKRFGRSKESLVEEVSGQLNLFEEEKLGRPFHSDDLEEEISSQEPTPKKSQRKVGQKKAKTAHLPEMERHHRLSGDACICDHCGGQLKEIGTTQVRSELVFWAAEMTKALHIQHAYVCRKCEKEGKAAIKKAPVPKQAVPNSLGSNSVVAESIRQKYMQKVPAYRQEDWWLQTFGLKITRQNIVNWHNIVSRDIFEPITQRFLHHMRSQEILRADETPYKVILSEKNTTYYWQFSTGKDAVKPVVLFHHSETRAGSVPTEILAGFSGYLHTDGYAGYQQIPNVVIVNCVAHARRKFFDAIPKGSKKKEIPACLAVEMLDVWFELERDWAELSPEERLENRLNYLKPLFVNFYEWFDTFTPSGGSKLEKAVNYALKLKRGFERVFEDGRLELSNNASERHIKELVMGRKNWLHSTSLEGAKASGNIISILQTAKVNQLDPMKYLRFLLDTIPNLDVLSDETLDGYMPWNEVVKEQCSPTYE